MKLDNYLNTIKYCPYQLRGYIQNFYCLILFFSHLINKNLELALEEELENLQHDEFYIFFIILMLNKVYMHLFSLKKIHISFLLRIIGLIIKKTENAQGLLCMIQVEQNIYFGSSQAVYLHLVFFLSFAECILLYFQGYLFVHALLKNLLVIFDFEFCEVFFVLV